MKKKENPPDIFETKCWEYQVINDPYQVYNRYYCFEFCQQSSRFPIIDFAPGGK
jgi:hypothetical protein